MKVLEIWATIGLGGLLATPIALWITGICMRFDVGHFTFPSATLLVVGVFLTLFFTIPIAVIFIMNEVKK